MPSVARFCHHCSVSAASWFVIILQIRYMQSLISVVVERQLNDQPIHPDFVGREITPGTVNSVPLIGES
jgi:pyrimidine operon attenuation protein/uracil phosphoribosyltransferase